MCRRRCSPQPFSPRALSRAQPKAPGATHPVLLRDIPRRAVGAGCQEVGRELVACHQRGWRGTKLGLVTSQSQAGAAF